MFTGTIFQEAVDCLLPAAVALRAAVGWTVALPCSLHGTVGARGRACAPGRPLIPGTVHWREAEEQISGESYKECRHKTSSRNRAQSHKILGHLSFKHDCLCLSCLLDPVLFCTPFCTTKGELCGLRDSSVLSKWEAMLFLKTRKRAFLMIET